MAEPIFTLVEYNDWAVLYADGLKVYEGDTSDVRLHIVDHVAKVRRIGATPEEDALASSTGITPDRIA